MKNPVSIARRCVAGSIVIILLAAVLPLLPLSSCRTAEAVPAAEPAEIEPAPPMAEPNPFLIDWSGTTWIVRDPEEKKPKTFPGYRGFHLGREGRLLLINLDSAVGDTWSAEGNILRLVLENGVSEIPVEGFFLAYIPDDNDSATLRIRLVPESAPDSAGLVFELAETKIDIVENHWIPKSLDGGDSVMWPMNRGIHLMLLPDGAGGLGILGYGGENRFRGGVILGEETFRTGPISKNLEIGPGSDFENLFVRRIGETTRYVQVDDDLFLYNETRPAAAFRVRLFD